MALERGQNVGIECEIQQGAFSNEYLVTVTTEEGPLTGFADADAVRQDPTDPSRGLIKATVVNIIDANTVKVKIYASFFTIASGTTIVSSHWAEHNLVTTG